jgi:hypothetical protein
LLFQDFSASLKVVNQVTALALFGIDASGGFLHGVKIPENFPYEFFTYRDIVY